MGIKVLFIYPNTFGMNMLPPAIATFAAILKGQGHEVQVFDTTYYAIDYGIDSDGTKVERLNVMPFKMDERGLRLKTSDWKLDLKKQVNDFKPDLFAISSTATFKCLSSQFATFCFFPGVSFIRQCRVHLTSQTRN